MFVDHNNENDNRNFNWNEFDYEFTQKKKRDWLWFGLFTIPIVLVAYNSTSNIGSSGVMLDGESRRDTYNDFVRLFRNDLLRITLSSVDNDGNGSITDEELMHVAYTMRKLVDHVRFNRHARRELARDEELLRYLVKLSKFMVKQCELSYSPSSDQVTPVISEPRFVYHQYVLQFLHQLNFMIVHKNELVSEQSSKMLIDSCLHLISMYETTPKLSKMNPFIYSFLTMFELFDHNQHLIDYFVERDGVALLETYIRNRNNLKLAVDESLQKVDEEAKTMLEVMGRTQEKITPDRLSELKEQASEIDTSRHEEQMSVAMFMSLILNNASVLSQVRESYPCVRYLVSGLGDGSTYGPAVSAEALLKLGVPSEPKERKPQFGNHQLNLVYFNGTEREISCSAELERIKFRTGMLLFRRADMTRESNELLERSKGTYVEHIVRTYLEKGKPEIEIYKAYRHPSGYGTTDPDLLIMMAEYALSHQRLHEGLKYLKQLQVIAPKHPLIAQYLHSICQSNQDVILKDSSVQSAIFSLDQYEACYQVKTILRAKKQ